MSTEMSIRAELLSTSPEDKVCCVELDEDRHSVLSQNISLTESTNLTAGTSAEDIDSSIRSSLLDDGSDCTETPDKRSMSCPAIVELGDTDSHIIGWSPSSKLNTCENCGQELLETQNSELEKSSFDSYVISMKVLSSTDICRICHCESSGEVNDLITPCRCKGTLGYVHHSCLQRWIQSSGYKHCELCGFLFSMNSRLKPLTKWKRLSMSKAERRKICCSVFFHVIAITCVVWSLYVLIERTASDLHGGNLQWTFWAKLTVVAIGLMGGLVFMYVQCKVYLKLWQRLKSFNRIIYVHDKPNLTTGQASNQGASASSRSTIIPITSSMDSRNDLNVNVGQGSPMKVKCSFL